MISTVNVVKFLGGIHLPMSKTDLVKYAEGKQAPSEVIDILNKLPDQQFGTMTDITHCIGEIE